MKLKKLLNIINQRNCPYTPNKIIYMQTEFICFISLLRNKNTLVVRWDEYSVLILITSITSVEICLFEYRFASGHARSKPNKI